MKISGSIRHSLRVFALFLLFLTLFLLVSCGKKETAENAETLQTTEAQIITAAPATTAAPETTTETVTEQPLTNAYYSFFKNKEYIKLIGRSRFIGSAIVVDWTAAGIEFEYQGSGDLKIEIEKSGSSNSVGLLATVDGKDYSFSADGTGTATYTVASKLPEGTHHVLIRRKTMVYDNTNGIMLQMKGVQMIGSFLPKPADNTYKVAFIGDSITCGVGLSGTNGLATYAVDLCTRESFDYDICCISGIGVYRSTATHNKTENTMTKYYPYFNYYRNTTLVYRPDRKADLVVVNLNTNDNNSKYDAGPDDEEPYKETLKTFISEIRSAHGKNVNIVWIVGMMITPDRPVNQWLNDVFTELGGESAGLYQIVVDTNTSGSSGHPDQESHLAVSQALSEFIREKGLLELPND